MNLRNFRVGPRLALGFGSLLVLLAAIVAITMLRFRSIEQHVNTIVQDDYQTVIQAQQVKYNVALIHQGMRNLLLAKDADGVRQENDAINAIRATNKGILEALNKSLASERGKAILAGIVEARTKDVAAQKQLVALLADGKRDEAAELMRTAVQDTSRVYIKALGEMVDFESQAMQEEVARSKAEFASTTLLLLAVAGAAMALGIVAAWRVTRSVVVPVHQTMQVLECVRDGDLTVEAHSLGRDEMSRMGQVLGETVHALRTSMSRVRESAESVATASAQIAQGNHDLSARTEQQASNLEQTAASMEEMTGSVRNNAQAAEQANQLAAAASEVALKGGTVVSQVVATMGEIQGSSRKIADIINVIDGIAFQTNILALNAAVEAARAGEQGRGFAVVAGEVRLLAQRSAEAAKQIKALITDSVEKVDTGGLLVQEAGSTMEEIVAQVRRMGELIGVITTATHEQTDGIGQVNQAVGLLDQMTQQNAALVEESAAAAESLKQQAQRMAEAVAAFKLSGAQAVLQAAHAQQHTLAAIARASAAAPDAARQRPQEVGGTTVQ
jgi:methyl-accepting chemotaxis protein